MSDLIESLYFDNIKKEFYKDFINLLYVEAKNKEEAKESKFVKIPDSE